MAIHNAIKYGTSVLKQFSRLSGLGEDEEGTVRLGETLTPVLDAWRLPEAAFLRDELIWSAAAVSPVAAGEIPFFGLRNPAGTRSLVIVEHIRVSAPTVDQVFQVRAGATLATDVDATGTVGGRDFRIPNTASGVGTPVTIFGTGAALAQNGPFYLVRCPALESVVIEVPWVLVPGFELRVYGSALLDTAIEVCFAGRTRSQLPGER